MGSGNSKGAGGFRVFRIVQGGPASEAGLEIFFDYIVEVNGEVVESDKQSLSAMISDQEGKRVKLTVYNCRSQALRDVFVIPRRWQGQGLLGLVVKYDLMENGENQGLRILEVQPNSPGALCGLIEFKDFIIGSGDLIVRDGEDLGELVTTHIDQELPLTIYNTDSETIREVVVIPKRDWGGDGLVGFSTGTGVLHRIPMARKPLVVTEEPSHVMPLEPSPSPDAEPASPNEPAPSPPLPELVAVGPPGSGPVSPKQKHIITLPIPQVSPITPARLPNPVVHSIATPVAEPMDSSPEVLQESVEQVLGVSVRTTALTPEPNVEELKKCVAEALGLADDAPQEVMDADRSSFNGAVVEAFEQKDDVAEVHVESEIETVQVPQEPSPPMVVSVEDVVTVQPESDHPNEIRVNFDTSAEVTAVDPVGPSFTGNQAELVEVNDTPSVSAAGSALHAVDEVGVASLDNKEETVGGVHAKAESSGEISTVHVVEEGAVPDPAVDHQGGATTNRLHGNGDSSPLTVPFDAVSEPFAIEAPTVQADPVLDAFGLDPPAVQVLEAFNVNPSPKRTPFGPVTVQPADPFPMDPVREAFGLSPEPDPFLSQVDPISQAFGSVSDPFIVPTGTSETESSIAEAFGLVAPANSERRSSTESGVLVESVVSPDISKLFD